MNTRHFICHVTLACLLGAVSHVTLGTEDVSRTKRNGRDYLLGQESHPEFVFAPPPPHYQAPHQRARDWRFNGPHHPRAIANSQPSFQIPNVHLDFRLDPYAEQKPNFYSKPKHSFNRPDQRRQTRPSIPNGNVPRPHIHPSGERPFPGQLNSSPNPHEQQTLEQQQHQQHQQQLLLLQKQQHQILLQQQYKQQQQQQQHRPNEFNGHESENPQQFNGHENQNEPQADHGEIQYEDQSVPLEQSEYIDQYDDQYEYDNHRLLDEQYDQPAEDAPQISEVFSHDQDQNHQTPGQEQSVDTETHSTPIILDRDNKDYIEPNTEFIDDEVTTEKEPTVVQPANLAELLAGASTIGVKDSKASPASKPAVTDIRDADVSNKKIKGTSKTRTSVPEYIKPNAEHSKPEYYDELYDEFVDMYYDADAAQDGEKDLVKNKEANLQHSSKKTQTTTEKTEVTLKETRSSTTQTTTPTSTTTSTTSTTTTTPKSTTTSTTTKKTTTTRMTTKKEKRGEVTTSAPQRSHPPISLSEVLQELGLSLPQFLGTLKTHGTSLKDFTVKLQGKSLSKTAFKRANGNVKILLEILERSPDRRLRGSKNRTVLTTQPTTKATQKTTTTTPVITHFVSQETTTLKSTSAYTTTVLPSSESTESTSTSAYVPEDKPRVFGSRPSGILFSQLNNNKTEIKEVSNSEAETSSTPIKPIDVDIATLMKEKGLSAADILHDFKTMFNISEPNSSNLDPKNVNITVTPQPEITETTVSLRPYINKPERNRPYRPLGYEGGNRNIHRGIVNNRMRSTARPTLRPPYVPKPPIYNYNEDSREEYGSNVHSFAKETVIAEDSNETPLPSNRNESPNNKNKYRHDLYDYNVVKNRADSMNVSTKSAIMAAGVLGGVALSVFIAIFIVVKYKSHVHRHRRRIPLTLPSNSSSSSYPPIYASRSTYSKECYQTSGFWTTLKKRFDPYSTNSSPTSM